MLRAAATRRGSESVLSSEEGKRYDLSYVTGVGAFTIKYIHMLILKVCEDKHRLSSLEKLSFELTNAICVIQATSETG